MMHKMCYCLFFVLLTGLVVGCSTAFPSSSATVTPTVIRTPTSQLAPMPLVGTYTMTLTATEIATTHNTRISFEVQPGGWTLVLRADGYYTATTGYHPYGMSYVGEGSYTVRGNQFTSKDGNCWEYFGDAGRFGTYTWSLHGKQLVFEVVKDQCLAREFVFTTHPWMLQA